MILWYYIYIYRLKVRIAKTKTKIFFVNIFFCKIFNDIIFHFELEIVFQTGNEKLEKKNLIWK